MSEFSCSTTHGASQHDNPVPVTMATMGTTSVLSALSDDARPCIERLLMAEDEVDLSDQPKDKLAAVLVLLYETAGKLRVLLTTRSTLLRAHPGQTALPGGKADTTDPSLVHTALREAHEEVGLPLDSPHVHQLCVLRPFLSVSQLLVVPVVALLTNLDVLADLVPCVEEVDHIFDHPLEAILDPSLMAAAVATDEEPLVVKGTKHWPYPQDFYVSPVLVLDRSAPREKCYRLSFSPVKQNTSDVVAVAYDDILYRMHRFRTCASPIKGLTADILIHVAELAYQKKTSYDRYPPDDHAGSATRLVRLRMKQYKALAHVPVSNPDGVAAAAVTSGLTEK